MDRRTFMSTAITAAVAASFSVLAAPSPSDLCETEADRNHARWVEKMRQLVAESEREFTAAKKRLGIPDEVFAELQTPFDVHTYVNNRAISQGLPEPYPWVFKPHHS